MKISKCSDEDVFRHYECIREIVCDVEEELFKSRMHRAVLHGSAFCVEGSSCFLYYLSTTPTVIDGVAFNGHTNPRVTLAFFASLFGDGKVKYAKFYPHANARKEDYKSLVAGKRVKSRVLVDIGRFVTIDSNLKNTGIKDVCSC